MPSHPVLEEFHPVVRAWFNRTFRAPTPPQILGWPSISQGKNTLILAPTGSGKTLAAFLWGINHLVEQSLHEQLAPGVRILYVSPLKALNNDIERNLETPLAGIAEEARTLGISLPPLRTEVRTGDTPQSRRAAMVRHPPDILITTPESLYLMVTSAKARPLFRTVQYVIVDEIHAVCGNKRGVHLSLTLERVQEIAEQEFVRIGLSATQRPLEKVASFLGGFRREGDFFLPRPVTVIDAGQKKRMDLRVVCAVPDFSQLSGDGAWPLVFTELLACIQTHTTTLIFVNNRRLAERTAATLNSMLAAALEKAAPDSGDEHGEDAPAGRGVFNMYAVPHATGIPGEELPWVQAYHGSMSRDAREKMEADLKAGKLRALVATSSLELGIDIGSVDLVVQLQSPKGIARGLQRVGRSGHLADAESKGRIFPTHVEDLVEATVVARAMEQYDVEWTSIPENCLDVLAQQIVAMVSVEEWDVGTLFDFVRRSYCYRDLPRRHFDDVLRMLSGRYARETFRDLRARISWDKVNDILRPLPGSMRLAVTNGGTIVDRGYYGVYLADGKTKVGEVDEEFVFETRTNDTFLLGTNVWRVDTIDANRLTVSPAPGQPARMPFWHGEGIGRSFALGRRVGQFHRMISETLDDPACLQRLKTEYPIDRRTAWNLLEYFRRQREAAGIIPHDRLLLIEQFRDDIGDIRLVLHSPFGKRINGLLGLVLARKLRERYGAYTDTPSERTEEEPSHDDIDLQMMYNDSGVLFRCPETENPDLWSTSLLTLLTSLTVAEAQSIVLEEVVSSPLFAGQFRHNATRALLMPKPVPGRRTPLWLQRLKAGDLLQAVRREEDFPITVETAREVLRDVLDVDHFLELVGEISLGAVRGATVHTEGPSPFSTGLLLEFMAAHMYEQPGSAGPALNKELLAGVADIEPLPSVIKPEAVAEIEARLQHTADGTKARSPEELMEILLRIGDLSTEEILARCEGDGASFLQTLEEDGRAVRIDFESAPRWIAGEERDIYARPWTDGHARSVVARYLQSHGPTEVPTIAVRYGISLETMERIAYSMEEHREIIRGQFPSGIDPAAIQWCSRSVVERMHRRSISLLRHEVTPCSPVEFTRFLFAWQGLSGKQKDVAGILSQFEALPLPAEVWERDIFRTRAENVTPEMLTQFSLAGNGVWVGLPPGRMRFVFRGNGAVFLEGTPESDLPPLAEPARRILAFLEAHGASFFGEIREGTHLSLQAMNSGIGELFWRELLTNDVFAEVTSVRRLQGKEGKLPIEPIEIVNPLHTPLHSRRVARNRLMQSARRALKQVPGWTGRWSLVRTAGVMGEAAADDAEKAEAQGRQMLERYGIVAREFHRREQMLPWPLIALQLQRLEMRGEIRRGYFVTGFSGMQFALPAAAEALATVQGAHDDQIRLLNGSDPANPYGAGVDIPAGTADERPLRVARTPGTYVAFAGGTPVLVIDSYGNRMRRVGTPDQEILREVLRQFVGMLRLPEPLRPCAEILVEYCDDVRPVQSAIAPLLRSLGFVSDRNQTMRRDAYG